MNHQELIALIRCQADIQGDSPTTPAIVVFAYRGEHYYVSHGSNRVHPGPF